MKTSWLATGFASSALAGVSTFSPGNDIEYAVSIPSSTAQSGSGDFFFQLSGPTSYQWIALGVGEQMDGSSIYVMYTDGSGNVTVSPRVGSGHNEPELNPDATVTLLEGSGIKNGRMVANVKCSGCTTWSGGSIDFTSDSQSFINAHRTGSPLATSDKSTELEQHQNDGQPFTFNLVKATGGSADGNPFLQQNVQPTTSTGDSGSSTSGSFDNTNMLLKAHGVIMGLCVTILFPLGGMAMRMLPVPWWMHGAAQVVVLFLFTAGFGIGYTVADDLGILYTDDGFTHTVFGTVIFSFFLLQPFFGIAHHMMYVRKQKRTAVSHAHIWWGRITILLAIINGGLGLQLADNTRGGEIAYGVIAGVIGVAYIGVAALGEFKRGRSVPKHGEGHAGDMAEKQVTPPNGSSAS